MYSCQRCRGTFGQFRTPGQCPLCGVWASVRCSGCGHTAHANVFIANGDRCPKCGASVSIPGGGSGGNSGPDLTPAQERLVNILTVTTFVLIPAAIVTLIVLYATDAWPFRKGPDPAPTPVATTLPEPPPLIIVDPDLSRNDDLSGQLQADFARARKSGWTKTYIYIRSNNCKNCVEFDAYLEATADRGKIKGLYIIRIDQDRWRAKLEGTPFEDSDFGNETPRIYDVASDGIVPTRVLREKWIDNFPDLLAASNRGSWLSYKKPIEANRIIGDGESISFRPKFTVQPAPTSMLAFVYRATRAGGKPLDESMLIPLTLSARDRARSPSLYGPIRVHSTNKDVYPSEGLDQTVENTRVGCRVGFFNDPDVPRHRDGDPPGLQAGETPVWVMLCLSHRTDGIREGKIFRVKAAWAENILPIPDGPSFNLEKLSVTGAVVEFEARDDVSYRFARLLTPLCQMVPNDR